MRTISTKLEKNNHEKFLELCNKEGMSISEMLRDLINGYCERCEKPQLSEESKPKIIIKLDDNKKPIPKATITRIN